MTQEYWNIPKPSDDFLTAQGTNLTVLVDHADNALVWGLGASDLTAFAGVFIALLALVISLRQEIISRKHNILSVKPLLSFERIRNFGEDTEGMQKTYTLELINKGLGVAKINDVHFYADGKFIYGGGRKASLHGYADVDVRLLIIRNLKLPIDTDIRKTTLGNTDYLAPNEKKTILSLRLSLASSEEFLSLIEKIKFIIEYEDLYGNKMPKVNI
tara:strand:- start:1237 stop:1881 length:645 start_codon:yes stop_codon:yes gene_type:complete